eukprot:CAMPEP_0171119772 /NCGR_PEP_ID=MMETSP0766_2-20121228/98021_1 /TAXON_ID=439317 /ORGANISM="Gambierdiscus australes, Strain CAWD 149" /LENGTH=64 /DNA_ID=CAMNT_0011582463 /DNA_START=66 /DNA_END=256 /DNA_ORIENTATION=+
MQLTSAACIEAVPAKPQKERAQGTERDAVCRELFRLGVAVLPRSNSSGSDQCRNTPHHVHDAAA